jgi:threonine aldolase
VIDAEQVAGAVRRGSEHNPRTAVVAIENTHNAAGGKIFPLDEATAISKICRDNDVAIHIDGARIFNAAAATGTPASEWVALADTVTFCFSKGLGAPIGSMACGSTDVMSEARRLRKRLGGGMRQVGVIAAAARVALETGRERLTEDHANARRLAEAMLELNEDAVDLGAVETNMVYLDLRPFSKSSGEVADALRRRGILTLGGSWPVMRLVTHRDVSGDQIETTIGVLREVLLG